MSPPTTHPFTHAIPAGPPQPRRTNQRENPLCPSWESEEGPRSLLWGHAHRGLQSRVPGGHTSGPPVLLRTGPPPLGAQPSAPPAFGRLRNATRNPPCDFDLLNTVVPSLGALRKKPHWRTGSQRRKTGGRITSHSVAGGTVVPERAETAPDSRTGEERALKGA